MSNKGQTINCPNCNHNIDVTDLLFSEVTKESEERHRAEMEAVQKQADEKFEAKKTKYLEKHIANNDSMLAKEKERIKDKVEADNVAAMEFMTQELEAQAETIKKLNGATAQVASLTRKNTVDVAEAISKTEAKIYKETTQQTKDLIEQSNRDNQIKIDEIVNKAALENAEIQKKLDDSKATAEELVRKQNQGSQQSQGEVQEIAIESWLKREFPYDDIEEIKKGKSGADTLQTVHTATNRDCGKILYESKRTQKFETKWIAKLKGDAKEANADMGVLITQTMPSDIPYFGEKDGVTICSYTYYKALANTLRDFIIRQSSVAISQENKGDKKERLYDFVTSNEYRLSIQAIVDNFSQMKIDLDKEKLAMTNAWKKREKLIEGIILTTVGMNGSIEGIAGSGMESIPELQLSAEIEDDDDSLEHDENSNKTVDDLPF
jgi:hypothetical protein